MPTVRPVRAMDITQEHPAPERAWPLVGRQTELAAIAEALTDGFTRGVVIAGPPGVGRSRLAREAAGLARAGGLVVQSFLATPALAGVPLGAFSRLLAGRGGGGSVLELFLVAFEALRRAAERHRLVVVVDDAHHLDDAGAALLRELATTKTAFVLPTVRSGERSPDPILSLWKDGLCRRLDLEALSLGLVDELLAAALGGPIDGDTLRRLWETSRGNLAVLHALVASASESGAVHDAGGIWRWTGRAPDALLLEMAGGRLDHRPPDERLLLEVLAFQGRIEVPLAETLASGEALAGLESQHLVDVEDDARRTVVRLANPLVAEAVRASTPPLRARALHRRWAAALAGAPGRRVGDVARLAAARLDASDQPGADVLLHGAGEAEQMGDHVLAERLARCALEAGGGAEAERLLAMALLGQGALTEAVEAGRRLAGAAEAGEALQALVSGRPHDALQAVDRLRERPGVDRVHVLGAAIVASQALAVQGQTGKALAAVEEGFRVTGSSDTEPEKAALPLLAARCHALTLAGRLVEAESLAESGYQQALVSQNADQRASWSMMLARATLARGRLRRSLRHFREAVVVARDLESPPALAYALANLATAAAVGGQQGVAEEALAEARALAHALHATHTVDLSLARAWVAAGGGATFRGASLATEAAEAATARGQDGLAAMAWHDAARLGHARAARTALARLASRLDGPLVAAWAAHAAAVADADGAALESAAAAFSSMGAGLLAAEATAEASAAYRRAGVVARAAASARRAQALAARCEGARTPALRLSAGDHQLTPREWEIARLIAAGLSNREAATRLFLSVRTVENHLHRIFSKFGISSRQDLRRLIEADGT